MYLVPVARKVYDINTCFEFSLSGHLQCRTNYNIKEHIKYLHYQMKLKISVL